MKDRKQQGQDFTDIATLEKLLEVSQSLIIVRDLSSLLQKIAESAGAVLKADVIVLYEYQEQTDDVTVPPVVWGEIQYPEVLREISRLRPHKESAVFKMLERTEPFYAANAREDWAQLVEEWSQEEGSSGNFVHREGIVSSAAVRLTADAERMGVLFVNYRTHHTFPDEERKTIELFATQAAIAIQNARLLANLQRQAKGHQTLNKVGTMLAGMLDEEANLKSVARAVADTLDCTHCTVFRVEDGGLVIRAAEGNRGWSLPLGRTFSVGQGVAGWVAQMGISTLVAYTHKDERFDPGWSAPQPDPQSLVVVPILLEGEVYGVISAEHDQAAAFDEQDQRLLETLALQASQAVQNARLFQRERTLRRQAEMLREVSGAISSADEMRAVAERLLDELSEVIEYRRVSLQLVREDGDTCTLLAARGFDAKAVDRWFLRPISQDRLASRIVAIQEPLILSEPSKDPDWGVHPATADVKSWVGIPLIYGQETIGFLTLDHDQPGFYTQAIKGQLVSFADQVAMDIRNVRLFDSAQRRIRDLEIVNEVVQIISTRLDYKNLLQTIVSRIADKLDCTHCTLFFPKEKKGELLLVPEVTLGVRSKEIMTRRFKLDEKSLAGWVFLSGQSLVLSDAKKDERFAAAREKRDQPRSMLVAPVKVGDQTIGVISADQDAFGWFSESDRRLVDALAQQAGIAIQRAIGLALLQDIGNQIISLQKVDDILQQVVSGAIKLTNTTSGVIYLVSGDGKSVTDRFSYPPGFDHPEPRMDREESITRQVIETGEMLIFPDAHQDARQGARVNPALYDRVRSMIAVPLKLEQKVIGVLFLNDADRHDFTETEVSLLSTLASQAAGAIQNARLIQYLHEVSRLALTGDYEKLAEYVVEAVNDLTAASVTLWVLDEKENVLRIQAGRGVRREYMESAITPVEPDSSITSLALRDRCPVSRRDIQDETEEPRFYNMEEAVRQGWRSFLSVPLLGQAGQPLGTLSVYYTEQRDFSESETDLLWTFANQAAVAFENIQTVRKLNTQLESLHRVVQEQSLEQVLERILEGVNAILGEATSSSINLYEEKTGRFEPSVAIGPLQDLMQQVSPRPDGTGRLVLSTGEALYLDNVHYLPPGSPTIPEESIAKGIKSFAALPLRRQERILGVLFVNLQKPISFSEGVKRILELFASQAAVAIENARLFQELDDRAKRLVRLQEVTAAISAEPSDLSKLLHSIVDSLRDIFKGASCAVRLYDSRKDEFGPREAVGPVQSLVDHPLRSEGTSQYVVRRREPLYIEDVSATPPDGVPTLRREVLALGIRAAAYLPLLSEKGVIGILYMDLTEPRQFSQYDKQILELFANQAVIAIENAELLRDLDERATQLLQLQEVTAAISAEPSDFEKVLDLIVASLNEMFGEASCAIRLYDSESAEFKQREREAVGELEHLWEPIRPDGISRFVVKTGAPLYVEDTSATPPHGQPSVREEFIEQGVRAVAYLPLISKEDVIGILYLNLTTPHQFSQDEKRVLGLFVHQAAIAIENARLFEQLAHVNKQLDRRVQELEVLTEIGRTVSNLDIDQILDLVYEQAAKIMDLSDAQVQIAFYDEAKDEVSFPLAIEQDDGQTIDVVRWSKREAKYRKADEEEVVEQFEPRARRDPPGLTEYVIRAKEPLLIVKDFEQKAADLGIQVWPTFGRRDRPTYSWLGVPMVVQNQVTGIISIQSLEVEHAFDQDHLKLLSTVANQAAVAIENARLLQQERQHALQLEGLRRIGLKITSTLDLQEVLHAIVDNTNQILAADFATIFPYSERQGFGRGARAGVVDNEPSIPSDEGLCARIVQEGQIIEARYAEMCPGANLAFIRDHGVKSFIGVPVRFGDRPLGVILTNYLEEHTFTDNEKTLLNQIASLAAVAIENATRTELIADRERYMTMVGLAADLVHRINNRAGTIPIRAQILEKQLDPNNPRDQDLLNGIRGIASDARALLDDSLEIERLSEAAATPELIDVDIGERLKIIAGKLRAESPTDIEVVRYIDANLPPVRAVAEELDHALWSVAYNGVEAMLPQGGGTIAIQAHAVEHEGKAWAEITISDEGPGIPKEIRDQLFEPFQSTKHGRLRGFGLWRARQVFRRLGGTIELMTGERPSTTFVVRLPGSAGANGGQNESC